MHPYACGQARRAPVEIEIWNVAIERSVQHTPSEGSARTRGAIVMFVLCQVATAWNSGLQLATLPDTCTGSMVSIVVYGEGVFMDICVVGTGYVGLVVGTCLSDLGFTVTCVDKDNAKIAGLLEGRLPIYEPGLAPILQRTVREQRLFFSTDTVGAIRSAQVVFIAVGTPGMEDGQADTSGVLAVADLIGRSMMQRTVVVSCSTP